MHWLCLWECVTDRRHWLRSLPSKSRSNHNSSKLRARVGDSYHSSARGLYGGRQWSRRKNRRGTGGGLPDELSLSFRSKTRLPREREITMVTPAIAFSAKVQPPHT